MSYILDALRRLEQDKELAKRGTSPMEAVFVPDIEGVEEPERMRLRWVGVGVVLLVTVIALTYWITRHTLVPPGEHAREGTARQLSSVQPGYPPAPPPPRKPAEVADPSPPIRVEAGSQPVVSSRQDSLAGRQERAVISQDVSEDEVIQEWRGSNIKINAIAYSRDEASRFAVVNLKTVHEGDRFEDLAVVEIQENGIVFEMDGTKYRVLLGKR
jgi:hypothetical protein